MNVGTYNILNRTLINYNIRKGKLIFYYVNVPSNFPKSKYLK